MITSSRKRRLPSAPELVPVTAKGILPKVVTSARVAAKTRAFDDFTDPLLPDWINVHGKLATTGGATPDVKAWVLSDYASGRHRTQMLSDSHRVKVTMQDGLMAAGKARAWLCGDESMNRYYGIEIDNNVADYMAIVKGFGPNSVKRFDITPISITNGDEFEVWFDVENSMIRGYQNGVEQCSLEVPAYEIQHGPGHRWCGVTMGADWWLEPGPNFAEFEAWDVVAPGSFLRDTMDGPGIGDVWVPVLGTTKIHRHWFVPQSMGPDFALFNDTAVVSDVSASQDSVKVVFSAIRAGAGKYTVAVCANDDLTSWIGVQFETGLINNHVRIVTGTGPTTYTQRAVNPWMLTQNRTVYTVTYDHATKTVQIYKGAKRHAPIVSWTDPGSVADHGSNYRRVGQIWQTSLAAPGVEPSSFECYDVTALQPL